MSKVYQKMFEDAAKNPSPGAKAEVTRLNAESSKRISAALGVSPRDAAIVSKIKAAQATLRAKRLTKAPQIRPPSARGLSDEAAETATKVASRSSMKNVVERGSKVKSWLKSLKFGGIGAVDNPLLSKESMDKAQDAAGDAMEGDAIKKARVRPLRKGGMSA